MRSAIYCEHNIYSGADNGSGPNGKSQEEIDRLRSSGFTTVILWSLHVMAKDTAKGIEDGDLHYVRSPIISGGQYVGKKEWPEQLGAFKKAPTSVSRVEVSIGSAGSGDWRVIKELLGHPETRETLRRNFRKLHEITGADAINTDDEETYDVGSTVEFAKMLGEIGYKKFTLSPYSNMEYWRQVREKLGPMVDRVYLQCYAGGCSNRPADWAQSLGMAVDPGLSYKSYSSCPGKSPDEVKKALQEWAKAPGTVAGGHLFFYEDILSQPSLLKPFADAINKATGGG